jgi:glycine/D-amino acid oxidase-like deaminating enzyme
MHQSFDYLIVGQGLAGSLLAFELLKSGAKIMVIDNPNGASSSKVAAGIFNPITGKRFVKTWLCDEIYPTIVPFYQEMEVLLNSKFLHKTPIARPISNVKEQNHLIGLADEPENENFIEYCAKVNEIETITDLKLGALLSKIGGWVNVPLFLEALKKYLENKVLFLNQAFDYNQIIFEKDSVNYLNYTFKKIIFCEGANYTNNPHFNWLPFNTVKGELLTVKMDIDLQNHILLDGIFIVPSGNQAFKVGATYDWTDKTISTTEAGKLEISKKLQKLIHTNFQIINHEAGIRPATVDRRPFLGEHPRYQNLAIFNGLGTKGVSLAPYFAKEMTNFLINNIQVNPEVNINRFSSLYLSSELG